MEKQLLAIFLLTLFCVGCTTPEIHENPNLKEMNIELPHRSLHGYSIYDSFMVGGVMFKDDTLERLAAVENGEKLILEMYYLENVHGNACFVQLITSGKDSSFVTEACLNKIDKNSDRKIDLKEIIHSYEDLINNIILKYKKSFPELEKFPLGKYPNALTIICVMGKSFQEEKNVKHIYLFSLQKRGEKIFLEKK